jgi:lipopolysaccharide export system permease protein
MRILDRYLLREFLVYLMLGLLGFIVIFIVVDLIEKMDVFLDHKAPWFLIAQYFLNLTPDVIVKMLPVALLLATFLALGQLNKFGELTAMRAGGLSLTRILTPVFGVAIGCVFLSLLLGEVVVPAATRARDTIFEERIQHLVRSLPNGRADVTYLGRGGRVWLVGLYLVYEKRMHEVSLQEFRAGVLTRRIDAAEATWDGKRWIFASGYVRKFEAGHEDAEAFQRMAVDGLGERPEDFAKPGHKPEEMNYFELRGYVEGCARAAPRGELPRRPALEAGVPAHLPDRRADRRRAGDAPAHAERGAGVRARGGDLVPLLRDHARGSGAGAQRRAAAVRRGVVGGCGVRGIGLCG